MPLSLFIATMQLASAPEVIVPVVPEPAGSPAPGAPGPSRFEDLQTSVADPARQAPNAERVPLRSPTRPAVASPDDALLTLRGASVTRHGGQGDAPSVRLRGGHGFEPAYFLHGIPLNDLHTGSQMLQLLPAGFLQELETWPDLTPGWVPDTSLSGAINFRARAPGEGWHLLPEAQTGSFGFVRGALVTQGERLVLAGDLSRSDENYPVRNDNGTVRTDDDTTERRRNNGFVRGGGGFVASLGTLPILGTSHAMVVSGAEERGLPGPVGSRQEVRLTRRLALGSLEGSSTDPLSGRRQDLQLFLRASDARRAGQTQRDGMAGMRATWEIPFRLASELGSGSLSLLGLHDRFGGSRDGIGMAARSTFLQGALERTERWEPAPELLVSASVLGKLATSLVRQHRDCGASFAESGCGIWQRERESPARSALLSVQAATPGAAAYARFAFSERAPRTVERYGSVDGIRPNPQLRRETSEKIEAGLAWRAVRLYGFGGRERDLIFLQQLAPTLLQHTNLARVRRFGLGAEGDLRLLDRLDLGLDYHFTYTRVVRENSPSGPLPRTPAHEVQLTSTVALPELARGLAAETAGVRARMRTTSSFALDVLNQIRLTPPPELDLGIWLQFRMREEQRLLAKFELLNVLDDRHGRRADTSGLTTSVEHLGFAGFPPPGRRVLLSIAGDLP